MSGHPLVDDLSAGYEALRAQAVGGLPTDSPRGRALLLTEGVPAWIGAWAAPSAAPVPPGSAVGRSGPGGMSGEIVRILAEMALGGRLTLAGAS
jgi:hypothetical protein